jgi:hypothetical protein
MITEGLTKDADVNSIQAAHEALAMLNRGNATEDSLESLLTGLGDVSLRTSLQMGDVWTSSDQNDLFHFCFPGLIPFRQLEERSSMPDLEDETFQAVAQPNSYNSTESNPDTVFKVMDIHYCYRIDTMPSVRKAFVAARRQVQQQVPCINFIAVKAAGEDGNLCSVKPAIQVRAENSGCWSSYYKHGGIQPGQLGAAHLNVGRGCAMKGMILYQLTKILGLRKEANRADRDLHLNFRLDNVRKEVSSKSVFEKRTLPPSEAYANSDDTFDLLSISMPASKAYTDGKSNALEPTGEPLLARFMGQRMGLSELDVAALADRYRCFDRSKPENPTRVLAAKFLQGTGLVFDGSCKDVQPSPNTNQLLNFVDASLATAAAANAMPAVACKEFGASMCQKAASLAEDEKPENRQPMCMLSCLNCIPADQELVSQMNQRVVHQGPGRDGYCDDQGCQSADPQGAFCKFKNPEAKRVPCVRAGIEQPGQGYCDDHGCESSDPSGDECRKKNQNAVQIPCAVLSRSNSTPTLTSQLRVSPSGCVDSATTGIRFRSGPQATCHDLRAYCGHNALSDRVLKVCPATCEQEGYACANTLSYRALPKMPAPAQVTKGQSQATTNASQDLSTSPAPTTSRDVTLPAQGCMDLRVHDKPVLTVHGVNRTCQEASSYCFHTANSVAVRAKCPVSCGECVPEAVEEASTTVTQTTSSQRETDLAAVTQDRSASTPDGSTEAKTAASKETVTTAPQHESDDYWDRTLPPLTPDSTAMGCDRRRRFGFCSSRRRDNPSMIPSTTAP